MSRWREMIADYGRVFSNGSTKTSSEVYSVDGDLETQEQLRKSLEQYFRPLFQRYVYGGEKVACHDLRRILEDLEYRQHLPPEKVSELADITDFNRGKVMSYTEFVRIVMGETAPEDDAFSIDSDLDFRKDSLGAHVPRSRLAPRGPLPVICRNMAPQHQVEERVRGYKCWPPAFFILLMTAAQIICYIYYGAKEDRIYPQEGAVDPEPYTNETNVLWYTPTRRREAWRFLTYCLLHDGYVDLIINVLFQVALGIPLEIVFSFWRVAFLYIVGVAMGSLGQSVTDHYTGLEGAAGGCLALVFGHVMAMIDNYKSLNANESESRKKRALCGVGLRIAIILILTIIQIGLTVHRRFILNNNPEIGMGAHIAGILTGVLLGRAFLRDPFRNPLREGDGFLGVSLVFIFSGFAIIFNIVYADYPLEDYV